MEQIPAHSGGQVAPDSGGLHQNEDGGGAGVSSSILMSDGGIASHIGGCINLAHGDNAYHKIHIHREGWVTVTGRWLRNKEKLN